MKKAIEDALKKALPAIQKEPELLVRYGLEHSSADTIRETGKIRIEDLETVASMHIFDDNLDRFGLTIDEGRGLRSYFQHTAFTETERLKELFPYLE